MRKKCGFVNLAQKGIQGLVLILLVAVTGFSRDLAGADPLAYAKLDLPEHGYWDRPLQDPFTAYLEDLKAGRVTLETGSEKEFLQSFLRSLGISEHSQLLLFSTTSLQLSLIRPSNPRAIYFNESVYVGYIPGGKMEIVSIDPELGAVFYLFDLPPRNGGVTYESLQVVRSERCMRCHANPSTGEIPGVVVKSVLPGVRGGSIDAFRRDETGHHIPMEERFGGWFVTGEKIPFEHQGNQLGRYEKGEMVSIPVLVGRSFDANLFPAQGSHLLPHFIMEHQAGFTNRSLEAAYRWRHYHRQSGGDWTEEQKEAIRGQARSLARYALFLDEAPLPPGGVDGGEAFQRDFLQAARTDSQGRSLRVLNLQDRMMEYRASYMLYEPVFQRLPEEFRRLVYQEMLRELAPERESRLDGEEKKTIRSILMETLEDEVFQATVREAG